MDESVSVLARKIASWRSGQGPAHSQLEDAVRLAILDGRVHVGSRLPSERSLAQALGISRTTVTSAYASLADAGFLMTGERRRPVTALPPAGAWGLPSSAAPDLIDLSSASPPAPEGHIHQAYAAALTRLPLYLQETGYDRRGVMELRQTIAHRFTDRGLPTSPDQILITHGAQHALALIAGTLLAPHARVLVEHPTYPNALHLFRLRGARITALPPIREPDDLDEWTPALALSDLTYLVPDFHNPLGDSLPPWARSELRTAGLLVIDESMVTLGLDGEPLSNCTPVAALEPHTITIGSASKSLWGGLRVGWLRADAKVIAQLAQRRSVTDLGNSVLDQLAVANLIADGRDADAHASRRRSHSCDQLRAALLSSSLEITDVPRPCGGLALWVQLQQPIASAMAVNAAGVGLRLSAGPRFSPTGAFQRHLRIPYTLPEEQLVEAVRRLEALDAKTRKGPHQPSLPRASERSGLVD